MTQPYAKAISNSAASFNARMRQIVKGDPLAGETTISADVGKSIAWYPDGKRPLTNPTYPNVSAFFLREGAYDKGRRAYKSQLQIDVFTSNGQKELARDIAGAIYTKLGLDLDKKIMQCAIAQYDYKAPAPRSQLEDIQAELNHGWEPGFDEDPTVTHLFCELTLYYR